jgi:hypothetical protein
MSEFTEEDVRKERELLEERSVGPVGSAAVILPGMGGAPVLKVKRTPETERVFAVHAKAKEPLEVGTQWAVLKQSSEPVSEYMTLALIIDWPEIGAEMVLVFPLSEERVMLEMLRDAQVFGIALEGELNLNDVMFADGSYTDVVAAALEATK